MKTEMQFSSGLAAHGMSKAQSTQQN